MSLICSACSRLFDPNLGYLLPLQRMYLKEIWYCFFELSQVGSASGKSPLTQHEAPVGLSRDAEEAVPCSSTHINHVAVKRTLFSTLESHVREIGKEDAADTIMPELRQLPRMPGLHFLFSTVPEGWAEANQALEAAFLTNLLCRSSLQSFDI